MFAAGFSWFQLVPGVGDDTLLAAAGITKYTHVHLHAWLACFAVIIFAVLARMGLEAAKKRQGLEKYYADEGFSARNIAEVFVDGLSGIMGDILTKADIKIFFPFIGSLFVYDLCVQHHGYLSRVLAANRQHQHQRRHGGCRVLVVQCGRLEARLEKLPAAHHGPSHLLGALYDRG